MTDKVTQKVYDFYQGFQFNEYLDKNKEVEKIQQSNLIIFQLPTVTRDILDRNQDCKVLEIGCGIGWLSIALASHYPRLKVYGIDYSDRAIDKAQALLTDTNLSIKFSKENILDFDASKMGRFKIVLSIGVLHHTGDFNLALKNSASLVEPGGILFLSLYHKFKRQPFIEHFLKLKAAGATKNELFKEYLRLDRRHLDPTRAESWFLDQVLHPHETQHTVKEVCNVLEGVMSHSYNSISGSAIPTSEQEYKQYELGTYNLERSIYDPGMFFVQLKKE